MEISTNLVTTPKSSETPKSSDKALKKVNDLFLQQELQIN